MSLQSLKKGITVWNRLEPRPRKVDFDRVLRAEVRDALWMLSRQWQFGELRGEDTGTAVYAHTEMETTKITKLSLNNSNNVSSIDSNEMLEARVEGEFIQYDMALRIEMGQHFLRILKKRLADAGASAADTASIVTEFKTASSPADLTFSVPSNAIDSGDVLSNKDLWKVTAVVSLNRSINGGELRDYLQLAPSNNASDFSTNTAHSAVIDQAGVDFLAWFDRVYLSPDSAAESAWVPERLEYQFACSAPETSGTPTILTADEYYHGSLDWYSFDFESNAGNVPSDLSSNPAQSGDITNKRFSVIPTEVKFAGMPNARWWEMEDRMVNLGDINANTTDTAKILLAEFGMIYSNDWSVIPWTVPVGSLSEVQQIVVTDVFGQRTKIEPAGNALNDPFAWSMYGLKNKNASTVDNRLFIPPVVNKLHESEPLESVNFIRDEMANMVWGVETIIPNQLGGGMDGYDAATQLTNFMNTFAVTSTSQSLEENEAEIQYKVANTVPENWIPFMPVKTSDTATSREIKLQRAAMPRYIDGLATERIRPRTALLQSGVTGLGTPMEFWGPYFVHEEEVPRSGTIVKRTWQRSRLDNGKVITWLGRRKTNGRGEGASGLAFDYLVKKE